jgi:uncharacterized protein (DUF1697 family)
LKHVALLRGINVGGKNKLPMATLRAIFEDLGCVDVATYIQSGNVVFEASAALAKQLPDRVAARIADDLGLTVPVVLRSATALRKIAAADPFADAPVDDKWRSVMFLGEQPTAARAKAFDPDTSNGETYALIESEVHLVFPEGIAKSKFTNTYVDRALDTVSTTRNWRTVHRLLEMTA